jgi:hypothetical protein
VIAPEQQHGRICLFEGQRAQGTLNLSPTALFLRLAQIVERYEQMGDAEMPRFHYGSHYSSAVWHAIL